MRDFLLKGGALEQARVLGQATVLGQARVLEQARGLEQTRGQTGGVVATRLGLSIKGSTTADSAQHSGKQPR